VSVVRTDVREVEEVVVVQLEEIQNRVSALLVQLTVLEVELLDAEEAVFCELS